MARTITSGMSPGDKERTYRAGSLDQCVVPGPNIRRGSTARRAWSAITVRILVTSSCFSNVLTVGESALTPKLDDRRVSCLGSNATRLRIFRRRIFSASASWQSFSLHGSFFRLRRNKKCHSGGLNPAPLLEPFFHKKARNCYINNSQTDPLLSSPLNSHTDPIGVNEQPDFAAPCCVLGKGRQVIPPPRDDQADTPTQSSSESPASSKAEARRAGSSDLALTAQSIQPLFLSLRSVGLTSPLLPIPCCFIPAL